MASVALSFSISANDSNINKCAYVWHRLVDKDLTTELAPWKVDTFNTNNQPIIINEELTNNTLKTCGDIYLEVYIIPCCALTDIIQTVNCSTCNTLPTNTPLPSVIPSIATHQYHKVTASSIANILVNYDEPINGYVIQQSDYYNIQKIRITGKVGCILGLDLLCTPQSQTVIYDTLQMNNGPLLAYFCTNTPAFEYFDGTTWKPFTNYTKVEYKSQYGCWFDTVLLKITNTDTVVAEVAYQKKDGTFATALVNPSTHNIVCAVRNTWFLHNRNNISSTRVIFEVLSVC